MFVTDYVHQVKLLKSFSTGNWNTPTSLWPKGTYHISHFSDCDWIHHPTAPESIELEFALRAAPYEWVLD